MKTLFISILILGTFVLTKESKAQLSGGANIGFLKLENIKTQLGINLVGKYDLSEKLRVGLNLGYYAKSEKFLGERITVFTQPITGLIEYSFLKSNFSPYVGADLGLYRIGLSGAGESASEGYFGFAPILGFNFSINEKLLFNTNFKTHIILVESQSTTGLSLNSGVIFKF